MNAKRQELFVYGFLRQILAKNEEEIIPHDIAGVILLFMRAIAQVFLQMESGQNYAIGAYDDAKQSFVKIESTFQDFKGCCLIPNARPLLPTSINDEIPCSGYLDAIFGIKGRTGPAQVGNKHFSALKRKGPAYLLLYNPMKLSNVVDDQVQSFDHAVELKPMVFQAGISGAEYCGDKYGLIYESGYKLYQCKVQDIAKPAGGLSEWMSGSQLFSELQASKATQVFDGSNATSSSRVAYSLKLLYLNGQKKLFGIRHSCKARDNRGIRWPPGQMETEYKIPCGIYDLEANEWTACGHFCYKALPKNVRNSHFTSQSVFDERNGIVYVFSRIQGETWVATYDVEKEKMTNLGKHGQAEEFQRGFGHLTHADILDDKVRLWYDKYSPQGNERKYLELNLKDLF